MSASLGENAPLLVWSAIIGIGLITFAIRFIPIALLSKLELPALLKRALIYVPPAVMTAIVAPALFFPGAAPTIALDTPRLVAAAVAALVALCNATASAQLAAAHPVAGGTYAYGRAELGPWWGFVAGWGFIVGKTASCAAMAMTFAAYAAPAAS